MGGGRGGSVSPLSWVGLVVGESEDDLPRIGQRCVVNAIPEREYDHLITEARCIRDFVEILSVQALWVDDCADVLDEVAKWVVAPRKHH